VKGGLQHPPLPKVELSLAGQQPIAQHDARALESGPLLERLLMGHQHVAHEVATSHQVDVLGTDPKVDEVAVPLLEIGQRPGRVVM